MTPPAAAGAITAPTRRRPASTPPRRRSGSVAKPRAKAASRHDLVPVLDRVLRGPAYIALVGVLLAGIVFFNVDLLKMNHGIAKTGVRAAELKRENAIFTLQLAKLGSSERIQRVALERGLVLPQPGDVQYLRADRKDSRLAARVMAAPKPVVQPAPEPVSQTSSPVAEGGSQAVIPTATTPTPTPQPTTLPTANSGPPTTQAPPQATSTGGTAPTG